MSDTSSEQWRHECECRDWIRDGYTTKARVDDLIRRISAKRGRKAAERVREGMREQYKKVFSGSSGKRSTPTVGDGSG